ncbi:hypothetical protein [Alkalibacillus silvisoli]|uniref:Uncharacterized protein n=1 Tax=Alkalibacillus silvisoli TaxID=392823 RepID=A0ABN0ZL48_9BACI
MEKQTVVLKFPKTLLNRVDAFKEQKGFGTRTQANFHLLQVALEQSDNQDSFRLSLVRRQFIPHLLIELRPSHHLKMGVFSPTY